MTAGIFTAAAADGRAFIRVFCRVEALRGEPSDMLDAPDAEALGRAWGRSRAREARPKLEPFRHLALIRHAVTFFCWPGTARRGGIDSPT